MHIKTPMGKNQWQQQACCSIMWILYLYFNIYVFENGEKLCETLSWTLA